MKDVGARPSASRRPRRGPPLLRALWALAALVAAGCSGGAVDGALEVVGGDVAPDAGVDVAPDAAVDDADATSGHDATSTDAADPSPDAGPDVAEGDVAEGDTAGSDAVALDAGDGLDASDTGPEGPAACEPPLAISPASAWAPPRELLTFVGSGGTGTYRFDLVDNGSGASVHPHFGAYLSGPALDAIDVVRLRDDGCAGEALATVTILPGLAVHPPTVEVPPGHLEVLFEVSGGSGEVAFELLASASGGVITPEGRYTAGPGEGLDLVRATDLAGGATADAQVRVVAGSRLRPVPGRLALTLDEVHELAVVGGSGRLDVEAAGGAAVFEAGVGGPVGRVRAVAHGSATLTLSDRHTGQQAELPVEVVRGLDFPTVAAGDSNWTSYALAAGDIDGDGFPDAIVTVGEADVLAVDSGALFIYAGTADGLAPEPARIISGLHRFDRLGRGVAVGDLDGDGWPDLVVSAHLADAGASSAGAVYVYMGEPGRFFSDAPVATLAGRFANDQHGHSLALCDFNGDGWLDLAVGARLGEDRSQSPVATDQGAVHLYLGGPGGFASQPDLSLWGQVPDGAGGFVAAPNAQLGWNVAAGDIDGDGLCDLAVAAVQYATGPGRATDGAVMVYRGRGPDSLSPGGLHASPSLVMVGDHPYSAQSRLGWALAVADLTGDGKAELVVGQPYYDTVTAANNGAVRVVRGSSLTPGPAAHAISADAADWTYLASGHEPNDYFGWAVAVGHWDDDGLPDLLVGNLQDEAPGGINNTGTVHVLRGQAGALPALEPAAIIPGATGGGRFGVAVAVLDDHDGDGIAELLVRAAYDSADGPRTGRTLLWRSDSEPALATLHYPIQPAGSLAATSLAILPDLDGDGLPELAVGAPRGQIDPTSGRIRPGVVALHRGLPGGFEAAPFRVLDGFGAHTTGDRLGESLAALADADGDGLPDLAVVAQTRNTGNACAPSRSNAGAVFVFSSTAAGDVAAAPAFTWFGPQGGQQVQAVAGADLDGDGLTDVIVGGPLWDGPDPSGAGLNVGGGAVIFGHTIAAGGVACEADWAFLGDTRAARVGSAVAGLGDVNGDGCEDVAVGARFDNAPQNNTGSVRVIFGWGPGCAFATPHRVALSPAIANSQAGMALAGGVDIDGDGVPDLAVGGHDFRLDGNAVGAAWIVPGSYLAALAAHAEPWVDGEVPHYFPLSPAGNTDRLRLEGRLAGEQFGLAVALSPPAPDEAYGALIVGRPRSGLPGVSAAGAVSVFAWTPDGLDRSPVAGAGGETARPGSGFGAALAVGVSGAAPLLVIGAPQASDRALDDGAAFVMPVR